MEGCTISKLRLNSVCHSGLGYSALLNDSRSAAGVLFLWLVSGLTSVFAAEESARLSSELHLAPRICVLAEQMAECRETVRFTWKTDKLRSVCLYRLSDNEMIKCWQQVSEGELEIGIEAGESIIFELRDLDTDLLVLAQTEFKVMRDVKKYRRGRRNPWSFF